MPCFNVIVKEKCRKKTLKHPKLLILCKSLSHSFAFLYSPYALPSAGSMCGSNAGELRASSMMPASSSSHSSREGS